MEATTVGNVVAILDSGDSETAWRVLEREARATTPREGQGLVAELLIRVMDNGASRLRATDPETPLRPWVRRFLIVLGHEEDRARPRCLGPNPQSIAQQNRVTPHGAARGWDALDLSRLTEPQREVFELRLARESEDRIATGLKISRAAVRGRIERAVRRLRSKATGEVSRFWAAEMLLLDEMPRGSLTVREARVLLAEYFGGATNEELPRTLGATPAAIKKRIQRWKKKWLDRRQPDGKGGHMRPLGGAGPA